MISQTPLSRKIACYFVSLLFAFLLAVQPGKAQQFNYSMQRDSVAWQPLNTLTLLNMVNTSWESTYKIGIGFTFSYLGQSFDSVVIASNGSCYFDADKRFSFAAYNGYGNSQDSLGNWSVLGYALQGDSGQRVLTLQFTNVAPPNDSLKLLSYQVLLHENGTIDIIAGTLSQSLINNSLQGGCAIGLLNGQMDTPVCGLFASCINGSCSGIQVTDTAPSLPQLAVLPTAGSRFRFIPNP